MPSSSSSVSSWSDNDRKKDKKPSGNVSDEKEYDSDGNELYVVEAIRDKKKHFDPKKRETVWLYHLKWKGYPESEMTWEPKENMDCPELLETFEKKWKAKQKARKEREIERTRELEREKAEKYRNLNRDKHKGEKRRTSFDSDLDKPSTSKSHKKSEKKRKRDSDSDSSDDERRKKSKPGPKSKKHKRSDSDSDDDRKKKKSKAKSDSDSDSDADKKKKPIEDEAHKKIMSKPGPKRAKEARLQKLKEQESKEKSKPKDDSDDEETKKKNKSYNSDSDDDKKKSKDPEEDDAKKKIMSKPGPKRAKEARLAKLQESASKPTEKPKDSDDESNDSNKKKKKGSDSDEEKEPPKSKEEQKIMSKPGPKRAKEARLAKLQESAKKPEKKGSDDEENSNDKQKSKSSDDESESKKQSENDREVQRIMSKPGPKRAKEAQIAKLNQSRTEENGDKANEKKSNDSNDKKSNDSNDDNSNDNSNKGVENKKDCEEQRKSIMSKPGPKRAKEARLQKLNQSITNNSDDGERSKYFAGNALDKNKRTNSTDSLDAIINTPAPEQEESLLEELEPQVTSPARPPLTNGNDDSGRPAPDAFAEIGSIVDNESGLSKIGNYVSIDTTRHIPEITNALSLQNGGLDMKKPGYVSKQLTIKPFKSQNSRSIEKILSAFYSDNKLCFLVKPVGDDRCDVFLADEVNKSCPDIAIDFYQSRLRFT